ncbi:proteinase-activated receptor 1-like isoform X2 [Lithobates pipiens]
MEVHLLLPLFLLHGIALFCAVKGDNMTEEFLVDNHTVTPRPTTMQNVTPPQCDNCTKEMTKHYMTTVLRTDHTTQGPSPPPSPTEYILIGESEEVYLRIKATFIVILNITEIRNVTILSPSITEAHGWCDNNFVDLAFIFPGGELWLEFRKNKKESLFYLETIGVAYLKHIRGEEIATFASVHLKTFITPLGHYFTSKEVNLEVAPDVSVVLLNAKVQAFEVNGGNFGNDKSEGPYYGISESPYIHWSVSYDNYKNPYINWRVTKLIPSIYTVVFLVALPLNIMAIFIFLVKIKVRKPAVVYMLNLATADLLLVSVLPFYIVYRFLGSNWIFGEGMCRFVTAAYYCNMSCSVLLLASISMDRFLAIVYPVRSLSWRTVTQAWLVCGVIWVISLASFVPLLMKNQIYEYKMNINTSNIQNICHEAMKAEDFNTFYFYFGTIIVSIFFLPQLCITFSYIGIICSLHKSNVDGTHKRTRAIRLSVVVLSVFVFSFLPIFVIYLIHYVQILSGDYSLYIPYMVCTSISSINCCLDPLIYYFASSEMRKYFYSMMCWKKN